MSSHWWAALIIAVDVTPPAPEGGKTGMTPPLILSLSPRNTTPNEWLFMLNPNTHCACSHVLTCTCTKMPNLKRNTWHKPIITLIIMIRTFTKCHFFKHLHFLPDFLILHAFLFYCFSVGSSRLLVHIWSDLFCLNLSPPNNNSANIWMNLWLSLNIRESPWLHRHVLQELTLF